MLLHGKREEPFLEERALPYIVVARLTSYLKSRLYQITEWQAIDRAFAHNSLGVQTRKCSRVASDPTLSGGRQRFAGQVLSAKSHFLFSPHVSREANCAYIPS